MFDATDIRSFSESTRTFGLQLVQGLAGLGPRWGLEAERFIRAGDSGGSGGSPTNAYRPCYVASDRQISDDLFSKNFVDLAMPRHRLGASSLGLVKDIVSRSMAQENTSGLL